ncbi:MAG TPA: efflux RND transporter periplasmic adaptor subunit [Salinimicrobium sp.]|nr:efflux RND transporter periplasmic adaptor subunit [Salinimicrobium sp.]
MKKKTLYILIAVVLVVIAFLIIGKKAGWFGKSGNFKEVEITTIEKIDIIETVSATGKIQPEIEVKMSSEVSGQIITLNVVENQAVKEGDLLVSINPDIYESNLQRSRASLQNMQASLAQSEANLREAKSAYDRNKSLFEKGIISKAEWDRIVAAYEGAQAGKQSAYYTVQSARATVSEAMENLGRTNIYASMDGTITRLDVELGERVVGTQQMAGTEILRVADISSMEVEVDVNENDIVKIKVGDSALVEVDAYLKRKFEGVVTEIANSAIEAQTADQVTNFKVKVKILEKSYQDLIEGKPENYSPFRPGMTATVDIITNKKEDIIGIPISAIVIRNDTTSTGALEDKKTENVFLKVGEKAVITQIKTGIQDNTNIEVTEGLEEGDVVITGPYNTVTKSLKDDDLITVKQEEGIKEEE